MIDYKCGCGPQTPVSNSYTGSVGGSPASRIRVYEQCPVCKKSISAKSELKFQAPPNIVDISVTRNGVNVQKVSFKSSYVPLDRSGQTLSRGNPLNVKVSLTSFGDVKVPVVDLFDIEAI